LLTNAHKPIVGLAAYSGVGKTTLLKKLIPLLIDSGIRLALVKHAHHDFDIDKPGKDSYELRKAGAYQLLITSAKRRALMIDNTVEQDPVLDDELAYLQQDDVDLILVEGFRHEAFPKLELFRSAAGKDPLYVEDKNIIAIATDGELPLQTELPVLDINQPESIVEFIRSEFLPENPL